MDSKSEILQELHEISSVLSSIDKVERYDVPENYFNNLADSVLSKIKSAENDRLNVSSESAPVLNSISKQNVYTVPANYFETFHVNIPAQKAPAKIISLRRISTFAKYAVAAAVAGIIFIGSFLYKHYNNSNISTANIANAVKNISDEELNNYANEHSIQLNDENIMIDNNDTEVNVTAELKTISNEELEQYCNAENLKYLSQ